MASREPQIELAEISAELGHKPFRETLPSRLGEEMLRSIARDFRAVELMKRGEPGPKLNFATGLFLMAHYLTGRGDELGVSDTLLVSEEQLLKCIEAFNWAVERELVARTTGLRVAAHEADFLAVLDGALAEAIEYESGPTDPSNAATASRTGAKGYTQ